jgi:hypothetical protein
MLELINSGFSARFVWRCVPAGMTRDGPILET